MSDHSEPTEVKYFQMSYDQWLELFNACSEGETGWEWWDWVAQGAISEIQLRDYFYQQVLPQDALRQELAKIDLQKV